MNCSDIQKLLSARFDAELSEKFNTVLNSHLAKCSACRSFEEDLVRCFAALNSLAPPSARLGFTNRVMSQLSDLTEYGEWGVQLFPVSPIRIGFGAMGIACGVALAILMVGTQEMTNTAGSELVRQDGIDYSEVFAAIPMNSIGGRYMAFANHEGK